MVKEANNKQSLLKDIQSEWKKLARSIEGLSDEQLLDVQSIGAWSIKDLQGHISSWEEEVIDMLQVQLSGQEANFAPRLVEEWNEFEVARKNDIPLNEIQKAFNQTHQRLEKLAWELPEGLFEDMTRIRLALEAEVWGHLVQHRSQIEEWRKRTRDLPS